MANTEIEKVYTEGTLLNFLESYYLKKVKAFHDVWETEIGIFIPESNKLECFRIEEIETLYILTNYGPYIPSDKLELHLNDPTNIEEFMDDFRPRYRYVLYKGIEHALYYNGIRKGIFRYIADVIVPKLEKNKKEDRKKTFLLGLINP